MTVNQAGQQTSERSEEFEKMVLEHLNMLYAVALRLTRNAMDAQDLTQNAVVKALRFHDRFQDGTYIKAWLLTILRNTFINEYRSKARRLDSVELTGTEAAPAIPPEAAAVVEDPRETKANLLELVDDEVRAALESLPDDFRTAVIMADLEDKSYKEIADAIGCPLGTVMSRLFRGRKLLRDHLQDYARQHRLVPGRKSEKPVTRLADAR